MVRVLQTCPDCRAPIGPNVPRDRNLYFTNVKCPSCGSVVEESQLVPKFDRTTIRWSGVPQPEAEMSLETEFLTKTLRHYSLNESPVAHRNTFVGSTVGFEAPVAYFQSAGTQETNKLLEWAVERQEQSQALYTINRSPGATVEGDFKKYVSGLVYGAADDPAQLDSNAWVGLEMYSNETSTFPLSGTPSSAFVRVIQNMKTRTQWKMVVGSTAGPITTVDFSVPTLVTPDENSGGDGHLISIFTDPFSLIVRAYVDGVSRATLSGSHATYPIGIFSGTPVGSYYLNTGMVLFSGAMTGATTIKAALQSVSVVNVEMDKPGSGFI